MKTVILLNKEGQYYINELEKLMNESGLGHKYEVLPESIELHFTDPQLIIGGVQALLAVIMIIEYGYKTFKTIISSNNKKNYRLDIINSVKEKSEGANNEYIINIDGNNIEASISQHENVIKINIKTLETKQSYGN